MIPRHLGMQGNDAMYSNAKVWMQTFDCCCTLQFKIITSYGDSQPIESGWYCLLRDQCFRLHLKFGIAIAQQESCWRSQQSAVSCQQSADSSQQSAVSSQQSAVSSQQSAVSSQRLCRSHSQGARGGPKSGIVFFELVWRLLCCAYASDSTENKGLLTDQALLLSKESLFRQQALDLLVQTLLFYACYFTD